MPRWLLLAACYLLLAMALDAAVVAQFSSTFPHDQGDPLLNTWLLWWNTQHVPLTASWWNAAIFYPARDVMALSELLIGLVPITAAAQWISGSPIAAYNTAFLISFPLCGAAAAWLAYELTERFDAAAVAGLAFAFAPYRMGQLSHLQMLAYYGAPVALAALHRYLRAGDRRWLGLFVVAWLIQALSNGYAMFHLAVLVILWLVWFPKTRRQFAEIVGAWALGCLPLVPILLTYWQVHREWHLSRDINEIKRFGVDLADFVSAPPELVLWGARLWTARPETAVFPGLTVLLVAIVWAVVEWRAPRRRAPMSVAERALTYVSLIGGFVAISALTIGPWSAGPLSVTDFHKPFSIAVYARILSWLCSPALREGRSRRSPVMFYAIAMATLYLLALGPEPRLLGRPLLYEPPYAWLMRLPGFATLRVPGRFAMLAVLCQATLMAFAITRLKPGSRARFIVALMTAGVVADGWTTIPAAGAPFSGPDVADNAAAVIELPIGATEVDMAAIYHQIRHQRPIVNGYSGYNPPHYLPLADAFLAGQPEVLTQIDRSGFVEAAIDRGRADTLELAASVEAIPGVQRLPPSDRWFRYLVPQRRAIKLRSTVPVPIVGLAANVANQNASRAHDGDIETGWSSGINQIGNEEVTIDLGSSRQIAAILIEMGAYSFGYPKDLAVEVETDDGTFRECWRDRTAMLTAAAAFDRPARVPLQIQFAPVTTRRVRLRQLATSPGIPWWIPEISVLGPEPSPAR